MKTFTFRYDPMSKPSALFADLARAAKAGAAGTQTIQKDEMSSNSIHAILSAMTEGRLQVFYAIADHQPASLNQLSQILKRDQANVLRDVRTLEAMRLVTLLTEHDGDRERLRPIVNYDRIVFDFGAARVVDKHKQSGVG